MAYLIQGGNGSRHRSFTIHGVEAGRGRKVEMASFER